MMQSKRKSQKLIVFSRPYSYQPAHPLLSDTSVCRWSPKSHFSRDKHQHPPRNFCMELHYLCLCLTLWHCFVFSAKSDSHGDKLRRRGQFVTAQEVISVRGEKDKSTSIERCKWWEGLERGGAAFVSRHMASGVREEKQAVIPRPVSVSHKRQHCSSLYHSRDIARWHRRERGEGALVSVRHWDRTTQPPCWWKVGRGTKTTVVFTLCSGRVGEEDGGCLKWHIPQKQNSEGGLCTALTPNGANDSPVIRARDCGKLGVKRGRWAIHRPSWPESLLNGEQYHSLSHTISIPP